MDAFASCPVCGAHRVAHDLVPGQLVRPAIAERIARDHPGWTTAQAVCISDLRRYQLAHLEDVLEEERGELTTLDREVLERIRKGELVARNLEQDVEERLSRGDRLADRVATFGGSWTFITIFFLVIACWMAINVVVLTRKPFDPYPFILLNLVLSCLAAIQAPIIMMSQNRREVKDRLRAEHDYQVNLKAELEVRLLHEKLDHLIVHQWQRLLETQRLQVEMLDGLAARLDPRPP
ncbi:MAG: DUF1003 domain-containing protein [Gemmatimonadales bacterium]